MLRYLYFNVQDHKEYAMSLVYLRNGWKVHKWIGQVVVLCG